MLEAEEAIEGAGGCGAGSGLGTGGGASAAARGTGGVAHECAEVTIAAFGLDIGELIDHVIGGGLEAFIAGGGVHEGAGGEVMAGHVTGELAAGAFPTAVVAVGLGIEASEEAEVVEEAVGVEAEDVLDAEVLGLAEGPAGEADGFEGYGCDGEGDGLFEGGGGISGAGEAGGERGGGGGEGSGEEVAAGEHGGTCGEGGKICNPDNSRNSREQMNGVR